MFFDAHCDTILKVLDGRPTSSTAPAGTPRHARWHVGGRMGARVFACYVLEARNPGRRASGPGGGSRARAVGPTGMI